MLPKNCLTIFASLLILLSQIIYLETSPQGEEISKWANELGNDLWTLGKIITKVSQIQTYGFLNAQVEKKNPRELLSEIVENIARMMDRKMDAIKCILEKAETEAEAFEFNSSDLFYQYYSSKQSPIEGRDEINFSNDTKEMYLAMKLNKDTHFYNLAVNTSHSSVHVPTNIYDRHKEAAFAIQWSKSLDDVFVQNYNSDPALYWQYFGSSSGIMRHYPAKKWKNIQKDLFDCRIRSWFIEAATCTKDVVILIDNSGSMDGMGKHIGALTVYSILETFSNNDYVNILNYSSITNYTIPCFEDMLVQATRENIQVFKKAVQQLEPEGKTNLTQALEKAFDLLSIYRMKRGCNETSTNCNQAIMVVTDGIAKNLSDTVMKYNYISNGTNIPVRIFIYLIGEEVTNVNEIMWMACANRGYYTHVQSLEQVTASVLKYINVIARPLVLQGIEHPVSWTHAYIDFTYDEETDDQINKSNRLLTSVAVPAFDTKVNKNNESTVAELLGVVGTDIPIDDIGKLTFPYKIGVNGYVFIVSNNGYVLMHPDLRPMFGDKLNRNFNSIDLTEVEQIDNNLPPREIDDILYNLRLALVNGVNGSMHNVSIKYHYDNMRRVTREMYDYYYAPLEETPFSIAIALPNRYGNYSLDVGDEISKNQYTGTKITDFFKGSNWKIHPNWVYCKYHYLEGHEFDTPEKELSHFLAKMYDPDFKWEKQYEESISFSKVECGLKTHGDDDYYCDRQLVQRLIFDAKNTLNVFQNPWTYQTNEMHLFQRYNATLRFVATMSGLTRWEYLSQEVENSTILEFGDLHSKAIDETWYKSAVIQHKYDSESFVYSVPFDVGSQDDLLVTGSYAIFPSDAGLETPGSVVGYQFSHSDLKIRVQNLTSKVAPHCLDCGTCSTILDCYIIDSSGFIIVSENDNDTGRFFGEIECDIMKSLLEEQIFEQITVYDFQAVCYNDNDMRKSSSTYLFTPYDYLRWFLIKIAYFILEFNLYSTINSIQTCAEEIIDDILYKDNELEGNDTIYFNNYTNEDDGEEKEVEIEEEEEIDDSYPCEQKRNLYILQQNLLLHDNYPDAILGYRPFYIKKIPFSNLLFIAINSTVPKIDDADCFHSATPQEIYYQNISAYPCQKLNLNNLPRRSLRGCFNEHPKEHEIKACGKASKLQLNLFLLLIFLFICKYYK